MASTKKRNFRRPQRARLFRTLAVSGVPSGLWPPLPTNAADPDTDDEQIWIEELAEAWAEQLLFRYGVVFRDLIRAENVSVPVAPKYSVPSAAWKRRAPSAAAAS